MQNSGILCNQKQIQNQKNQTYKLWILKTGTCHFHLKLIIQQHFVLSWVNWCNNKSVTKYNLYSSHYPPSHSLEATPVASSSFECQYCSKNFSYETNLKGHMQLYHNVPANIQTTCKYMIIYPKYYKNIFVKVHIFWEGHKIFSEYMNFKEGLLQSPLLF